MRHAQPYQAPPHPLREYLLWAGPLAGAALAARLAEPGIDWVLLGALIGYLGEWLGARLASREPSAQGRTLAFTLVVMAALGAIPWLVWAEVRPGWLPPPIDPWSLLLVPLAAGVVGQVRYGIVERGEPLHRPAPRADPVPPGRWGIALAAIVGVVLLGWFDARIPEVLSLDAAYLAAALLVAWYGSVRGGGTVAAIAVEAQGIARGYATAGDLPSGLALLGSGLLAAGMFGGVAGLAALGKRLSDATSAARTDPLTNLTNRSTFLQRLEVEVARAARYARPLSLAYLDLDGFKWINDQHGHPAGDEVLRIVAGVLRTSVREQDIPARLGGDEFAVLLVETDAEGAARVMGRLRSEVEERMRAFEWPVTCSVGVVTSTSVTVTAEAMIRCADDLMYEVKNSGKNAMQQAILVPPE